LYKLHAVMRGVTARAPEIRQKTVLEQHTLGQVAFRQLFMRDAVWPSSWPAASAAAADRSRHELLVDLLGVPVPSEH